MGGSGSGQIYLSWASDYLQSSFFLKSGQICRFVIVLTSHLWILSWILVFDSDSGHEYI